MKNNSKLLNAARVFALILITSFIAIISFSFLSRSFYQQKNGTIDGYAFPKDANIHVELIISNPADAADTTTRRAQPDANGYFKFTNVPEGGYQLVFWPKNPNYISSTKTVKVAAAKTASISSVTLKKMGSKPVFKTE